MYTLVIGGTQEFPLATIAGWREVKKFVAGLRGHTELQRFAAEGISENLDRLEADVMEVLIEDSAIPANIESTLSDLRDSLLQRKAAAVSAFVSDGMGPGNDA